MGKKTKAIALGGIVAALTFVLCWIGSVSMSAKFIMPAICGILLTVVLRLVSGKVALAVYGVSALLLLLLPNRLSAYAYILLLGYYPILCEGLKKRSMWLQLLCKAVILTAVGCIALFAGAAVLGLWENEKFLRLYPFGILVYYIIAVIYDLFLWLLRSRFDAGWEAKLKKLFR